MAGNGTVHPTRVLKRGEHAAVYLSVPLASLALDKLPKGCKAGDTLQGTVSYGDGDNQAAAGTRGSGKLPGGYEIRCIVPPKPSAPLKAPTAGIPDGGKDEEGTGDVNALDEAVRGALVSHMKTLEGKAGFDALYALTIKDHPHHVPALLSALRHAVKVGCAGQFGLALEELGVGKGTRQRLEFA